MITITFEYKSEDQYLKWPYILDELPNEDVILHMRNTFKEKIHE